jgi:mannonate dehydratase
MAEGFRHIRVQIGVPEMAAYFYGTGSLDMGGGSPRAARAARVLHDAPLFEPALYIRRTLKMLEACRKEFGDEVELLHDVHERLAPTQGLQFARDVEEFKLFFLEDLFSPEDLGWFRLARQQCATPMAMGELFNSPHEWTPLIAERLIDYIRIHVSQAGGVTPCRKIAALGEAFGVRTAWHGPGDVSPVGHAANVALDLACHNFGIQEYAAFDERVREVFPGTLEARDGYLFANEAPGWGIEVNEQLAARYPFGAGETGERERCNGGWGELRRRDGSIVKH